MVSRWDQTEDWDALVKKIGAYSRNQKKQLKADCTEGNGRLGMIAGLSVEWRTRESGTRTLQKRDERRRKLAETLRWIRVESELRPYSDLRTRALLPPQAIHETNREDRYLHGKEAWAFFQALDRGGRRGRSVQQIVARIERMSGQAWVVAHPYGPAVEPERVAALYASIIRCRPRAIRPHASVVMSQERATAVVLHLLSRIA